MKTIVLDGENAREAFMKICERNIADYKKYGMIFSQNLIPLSNESYHFFTNILHPNTREEKTFYNLLFSALFKAEKMAGGSSFLTYLSFLHLFQTFNLMRDELPKNIVDFRTEWDNALTKFKAFLEDEGRPISKDQFEKLVLSLFENSTLGKVVFEALNMAGLDGTIIVEDGKTDKYVVEYKEGYRFPMKVYNFFLQNQIETKLRDAKILIVDGIIETVGEIDQLLLKSQAENCPLVIFAQGFNEEILATLKHNIDLGRLRVFPVKIPTEIESLNVVNDLAYACNSTTISALVGQKISMTKWEDLHQVDAITLTENEVSIFNPKSSAGAAKRLQEMINQKKNSVPEVQEFIDRRMKSLIPSMVVIRLPKTDRLNNEKLRTELDIQLRTIKSIRSWGVTDLSAATKKYVTALPHSNMDRALQRVLMVLSNALNEERAQSVPLLNVFLALFLSGKQVIELFNSSHFVKLDLL